MTVADGARRSPYAKVPAHGNVEDVALMLQKNHFRAHRRHAVDLLAVLQNLAENSDQEARILDLGLEGARIELPKLVFPEVPIALLITAPSLWDPLVLRGRIVWSRQAAGRLALAGLQFQHPQAAPLMALVELLGACVYDA